MKIFGIHPNAFFAITLLFLTACSSSTSGVDEPSKTNETVAAEASEQAEEKKEEQLATVINKPGTVKNRGVYIKLLVNKVPITNFDINRRAAFIKLRGEGGNRKKKAEQEMIEQVLKLQEASRTRSLAPNEMVDEAFANFAKRNRATTSQLAGELNRLGVGATHFRDYIRTQISWRRVVTGRFQSETRRMTEGEAVAILRDSGSGKAEVQEFSFQQVIFVVPRSQRSKSRLAARRNEANNFKQRFEGCDGTLALAKSLKDVSVIERRRILEPELPERWKDEVKNIGVNQTTRAIETERGIEVIAICGKKSVNDDRASQVQVQANEFNDFADKGDEVSKKYLDELKSRATIVYQ